MTRKLRCALTAAIALSTVLSGTAMADPVAGAARVVDGDGLVIEGVRVRLWGIDAPELGTAAGAAARDALAVLVAGAVVVCDGLYLDRYGRTVAVCRAGGVDLACAMVAAGHARDWPRYSGGAYAGCGG